MGKFRHLIIALFSLAAGALADVKGFKHIGNIAKASDNDVKGYDRNQFPDLDPKLNRTLWQETIVPYLPVPKAIKISKWSNGFIPQQCLQDASTLRQQIPEGQRSLYQNAIEAFWVEYDDCPTPWVFCIDSGHKQTEIIEVAYTFGRLPVVMRNSIRILQHFDHPNGAIGGCFSSAGNIFMYGGLLFWTLMHEVGHAVDATLFPGYLKNSWAEDCKMWDEEVRKDARVEGSYSLLSRSEMFAEHFPLAIYDAIVPGGIGAILPNWHDVVYKYHAINDNLPPNILQPGGTCKDRVYQGYENITTPTGEKLFAEIDHIPTGMNITLELMQPSPRKDGDVYKVARVDEHGRVVGADGEAEQRFVRALPG